MVRKSDMSFPSLKNDLIIRAAFGEVVERVPVWIMRQVSCQMINFHVFDDVTSITVIK